MLQRLLKENLVKHPTGIIVVAAIFTSVLLGIVYAKIELVGQAEREETQNIRALEKLRGRIVLYGEILTNATLMAAVTGNDSWSDRFQQHQPLLDEAIIAMGRALADGAHQSVAGGYGNLELLEIEYKAFELIQQNRADEARHLLFGKQYQLEKGRYKEAIDSLTAQVDESIEKAGKKIRKAHGLTQQFILAALAFILGCWVFVLVLVGRWQQEIRQLAYYDPLTGLASRRYFSLRVEEVIKSAQRRDQGFALLFMDLDGFKDVNDSMGHDVGDYLLVEIAARLKSVFRDSDFIARLGGDEFCVILEETYERGQIESAVSRCIAAIERPVPLNIRVFRPSTSIGIARFPDDGETSQNLVKSADSAMYLAKQRGKHSFEYYSAALTDEAESRLTLIGDLQEAFLRNEFRLHYQPIVNLHSGRISGVEALVRWQHPQRGLLLPFEFIPQLEDMGMIGDLGEWVLAKACADTLSWTSEGVPISVSVNISPTHFLDTRFVDMARDIVKRSSMPTNRVIFEVTESVIQNGVEASQNFNELREMGFRLAIDDFGTGYSSMGSLQNMPIDILKIDRVFICDLLNRPRDSIMLGTIMGMAHALGLKVVAEGVEELGHVQALASLGCDYVQGYYFSHPLAADLVVPLLDKAFTESEKPEQSTITLKAAEASCLPNCC